MLDQILNISALALTYYMNRMNYINVYGIKEMLIVIVVVIVNGIAIVIVKSTELGHIRQVLG